ncbi:MAG: glutathione peroxidase [Clostridiales bacterium]|nr:glutathione peroxidase [Clostridiales bacterium]
MNVYDFTVKAKDGSEVSLSDYKGKVLLIVNTATRCGFTPQYKELQDLYSAHRNDGFEILDFPCNQFAEQAPGTDEEIGAFCTMKYGTTFPQFAKIEVFGENQIPLYKWLEENSKFEGFSGFMGKIVALAAKSNDKDYKNNSKVKWNFTKFLIDRNGNLVARFEPTVKMKDVIKKVEEVLKQSPTE